MAEIIHGVFQTNETNAKSNGGTERLTRELVQYADLELLKQVHVVSSRIRSPIDRSRPTIFWAHDLAGDPESDFLYDKANHNLFDAYVFVSNWQMQQYIHVYGLPWSKCNVISNAIVPLRPPTRNRFHDETLRFIYTPTPHRGLDILYAVFDALYKKHKNIHLDVYSSFELYGWSERDKPYKDLFERIQNHEAMTYHGTQPNDVVRNALEESHIFAYPSTWEETSCLCLIEAMSAGLVCVHSNYGALYETAMNNTIMYQYDEDKNRHARRFYDCLDYVITQLRTSEDTYTTRQYKTIIDLTNNKHAWEHIAKHWNSLFRYVIQLKRGAQS